MYESLRTHPQKECFVHISLTLEWSLVRIPSFKCDEGIESGKGGALNGTVQRLRVGSETRYGPDGSLSDVRKNGTVVSSGPEPFSDGCHEF